MGITRVKPPSPRLRRGRESAQIYAAWPLARGGAPLRDYAGANPLAVNGALSWVVGPDGPALSFPGNNTSYLQTSQTIFNPLTFDLTAAIWFYASAVGTQQTLIQQLDGTGTGRNWLFLTATRQLSTNIGNATTSGGTVTAGAWHHAAVTTQGPNITLYFDGVAVGSSVHMAESNVAELRIGVSKSGGNLFAGLVGMAGITLWTRALTAAEVLRLYNQPYRLWRSRRSWAEFRGPTDPPGDTIPPWFRRRRWFPGLSRSR